MTDTKPFDSKLYDGDRDRLIGELQVSTELGRLNHEAIKKIFKVLQKSGFAVVKVEPPPSIFAPAKAPVKPKMGVAAAPASTEASIFAPHATGGTATITPPKPPTPPVPMYLPTEPVVEGQH